MDDLEWASGGNAVRLALQRDPPAARLSVHGAGDLNITLPVRDSTPCMQQPFGAPLVPHALRAALCARVLPCTIQ